jgi:hypothetical protein
VFNVLGSINWIAVLVAFVAYFLEATGRRARRDLSWPW